MRRSRARNPLDRRALALSAAMHAALFALGWASTLYEPEQVVFLTYEIEMVSPPPAVQAEEVEQAQEELVVETPDPEPLPPEPEPEEVVPATEPEPEPRPQETAPPEEESPPEPEEETNVAAAPEEVAEPTEVSGEDIEVRIEGLRRDYPEYYANIIRQIERCFRWREGGSWRTTVRFWITRAGSTTDIEFETRSGNASFDFEAMGAVDCAGRGVLGPLPEDFPYERLPVRFQFEPRGLEDLLSTMAGAAPAASTSEP